MRLFNIIDTQFERFDETVHTYLQKTLASLAINYTNSQIFGAIFNAVKGVVQNAMFYIEDALTEQNIYKATRKESVYSLAKISGFEAYYGAAACGTIICQVLLNNGLSSKSSKIYLQDKTKRQ